MVDEEYDPIKAVRRRPGLAGLCDDHALLLRCARRASPIGTTVSRWVMLQRRRATPLQSRHGTMFAQLAKHSLPQRGVH